MEQENRINEILESTKGMQKAEPDPFLFEKIAARIEKEKVRPVKVPFIRWAFAVGTATAIVINVLCISLASKSNSDRPQNTAVTELVNEMGYKTNYNY
jgi:hypothetical protein